MCQLVFGFIVVYY